jgi:hypothetical protein
MYNELNYRYNDNNFRHNINILIHFKKYFQDIHQCTSNKKKLIIIIKKYLKYMFRKEIKLSDLHNQYKFVGNIEQFPHEISHLSQYLEFPKYPEGN